MDPKKYIMPKLKWIPSHELHIFVIYNMKKFFLNNMTWTLANGYIVNYYFCNIFSSYIYSIF